MIIFYTGLEHLETKLDLGVHMPSSVVYNYVAIPIHACMNLRCTLTL